jgi:hypothetical protein
LEQSTSKGQTDGSSNVQDMSGKPIDDAYKEYSLWK